MCQLFDRSARAAIFVYLLAQKTQTRYRTLRSSFRSSFVEFRTAVSEEMSKLSQPIRGQGSILIFRSTLNTNTVAVSEEKSKMSQQIRGQGGNLVFPIGQKFTNLVEDVEILLPVQFRWILLSGFRGEVENVSANQRPGRPSCFSDPPEKQNYGRGRWDLASCQVILNSVKRFQRRSWKCLS